MNTTPQPKAGFWGLLHQRINQLYNGDDRKARVFRWMLLGFDGATITYFLVASFFHHINELHVVEEAIGIVYLMEWLARTYISKQRLRDTLHPTGLADLIVIASLLAPGLAQNFSFLRVVRALRLLRAQPRHQNQADQQRAYDGAKRVRGIHRADRLAGIFAGQRGKHAARS